MPFRVLAANLRAGFLKRFFPCYGKKRSDLNVAYSLNIIAYSLNIIHAKRKNLSFLDREN